MYPWTRYLQSIQGHEESQNIIGSFKDPENAQVTENTFHPCVLFPREKPCYHRTYETDSHAPLSGDPLPS